MENLVSHQWLNAHLNDPGLVVIDCTNFAERSDEHGIYRTTSGRADWQAAHIPGSRHADFTAPGFTGDASCFRNTLPEPQDFADTMARLGVHDAAQVVLYDGGSSQWAARVWWMLRWIGFGRAAVLDGGWQTWEGPVSQTQQPHDPGEMCHDHRPDLFVTRNDVMAALLEGTLLIDALSEDQFLGHSEALGLKGHIPGAINIPGESLLDPQGGCFLPVKKLAALFPQDRNQRCIVYCGSGVAAASVAFTMMRLGFTDVAIYMPGLQDWITDPSAPVVNG